jgi:hypothetical protein
LGSVHILFVLGLNRRPEFISINQQAAFIAIRAEAAGDHFNWGADLYFPFQIGQLGCNQRAFLQLDQGDGVRDIFLIPGRGFVNGGIRINFSPAAERIQGLSLLPTLRAYIPGWEYLGLTMRTHFTN